MIEPNIYTLRIIESEGQQGKFTLCALKESGKGSFGLLRTTSFLLEKLERDQHFQDFQTEERGRKTLHAKSETPIKILYFLKKLGKLTLAEKDRLDLPTARLMALEAIVRNGQQMSSLTAQYETEQRDPSTASSTLKGKKFFLDLVAEVPIEVYDYIDYGKYGEPEGEALRFRHLLEGDLEVEEILWLAERAELKLLETKDGEDEEWETNVSEIIEVLTPTRYEP